MPETGALGQRQMITIGVFSFVTGLAIPALGERAWWVIPPVAFAFLIGFMALDGRRPLTFGWLGLAAALAVAIGAFLKLT